MYLLYSEQNVKQKKLKRMVYHVIIALNSVRKRKVGEIISLLEKKGLELKNIRKRVSIPGMLDLSGFRMVILRSKFEDLEAMDYYRERFSDSVLSTKLAYFFGNHVDLLFEDEKNLHDIHRLWMDIFNHVFKCGKKLPIMFVVDCHDGNGTDKPFIHEI